MDFDDPWIFWLPVLYLYFVPFIGFQIKYDDDDDDDDDDLLRIKLYKCLLLFT